jgi:hypothetical protein
MASRSTKPFLVASNVFRTDEPVPRTGIYAVSHAEHRLPREVTVFAGQVFPRCAKCSNAVTFQLVRAAPEFDQREFRVWLHAIPPVETDVSAASERKAG